MNKIPYVNLGMQWELEKEELLPIIDLVLSSGSYIGGGNVIRFEEEMALFCGTKYCIALNSGTDALVLGLAAMGVKRGDEVITPPNSFIASTAAICHLGATPVFVDVLPDQNIDPSLVRKAISLKTKAIMPVHLTGRMAKMDEIEQISREFNIPIIEDAAQAVGSKFKGIPSGKWGKVGCFSTHPLKNLNGCGDGGFLVTDEENIANFLRLKRSHGLKDRNTATEFGYVSRMDELQAAILSYRLKKLDQIINKRRKNASIYGSLLDAKKITIPLEVEKEYNTYHTYVIQVDRRDELQKYLSDNGIGTSIHYPIPIHLQPAAVKMGYKLGDYPVTEIQANRILSLPVNQFLSEEDIEKICSLINYFY